MCIQVCCSKKKNSGNIFTFISVMVFYCYRKRVGHTSNLRSKNVRLLNIIKKIYLI